MFKGSVKWLLIPLLVSAVSGAEAEQGDQYTIASKKWEVGISAAGFIEGSTGDALHSSGAGGIRASYRFDPAWSVTGDYLFTSNVGVTGQDTETDIHRALLSVDWDAWPNDNYSPFLLVGGGYEAFPDMDERDGILVFLGGGVRYIFAESWGVSAEGKLKWNMDHQDQGAILTVSLNYRFSSGEEAK